jgi:two-component system CheB/CheR fusion protein
MAGKPIAAKPKGNSQEHALRLSPNHAPPPPRADAPALVVGLGASAGGLDAFQRFFRAMPADSGAAFVLIAHLDPHQKSALPDLLARTTPMPVVAVARPVRAQANHVYVIAPNTTLRVRDGTLIPEPRRERHAAVDDLFRSLAESWGPQAVCIVLSGTGADGTLGLTAVKEAGGLTMAQTGESAQYPGMPRSAVATGLVDLVLPAERMPEKLVDHARRLSKLKDGKTENALQRDLRDHLINICTLLRAKTGHDFSQYKQSTLIRRIQRRMQVVQLEKVSTYLDRLRKDGVELEALFQDMLIGVTHFFRDREAFAALETKVIPKLFENRIDNQIRVWVPGCATGEEAYSIAMLLHEHAARIDHAPRIQVFATDIDARALEIARAGIYPAAIARDVPAKRLKNCFTVHGSSYQIVKDVRDLCIFSSHNVIKDPPFSRLDLISCRNLLIYMNAELQNRLTPVFHFALRPNRFLFLGPSENVSQNPRFFVAIDKRHRLFRASAAMASHLPSLTMHSASERGAAPRPAPPVQRATRHKALISAVERTLQSGFVPAHVVVNERHDLVHSSSGTGMYLELAEGAPNANLLSMARKGLRIELRTALTRATRERRKAVSEETVVATAAGPRLVRVAVEPLLIGDDTDGLYLVVFQDHGAPPLRQESGKHRRVRARATESRVIGQLQAELDATQERLQATVEELETANEELKSSNEEFQSVNEELQSANEELETSREELQSINEELETVNGELTTKVEGLDRANSDLKNFLESTQIATIFLSRDLRIKGFTPKAKDIFHLMEADIGRPITDLVTQLADDTLPDEARRVMAVPTPIDREVRLANSDTTFLMRILPYRTVAGAMEGVVITYIDITERIHAEEHQRLLLAELNHRVKNMLATILSIANQTITDGGTLADFQKAFTGRIRALSETQNLLTRTNWTGVTLRDVLRAEAAPYAKQGSTNFAMNGPDVMLTPRAALSLSLVVHELTTNAVKYGALSRPRGRVAIRWSMIDAGAEARLRFEWLESGGPPVKQPTRRGFGRRLIEEGLTYDLGGKAELAFDPGGFQCRIELPAADAIVNEHSRPRI